MESTPITPETIEKLIRQGFPQFGDAFVGQVMDRLNQISPLQPSRKHPALKTTALTKLKYQLLVQIMKRELPETERPISMEVTVVDKEEMEMLLKEGLLVWIQRHGQGGPEEPVLTESGRRFVQTFESCQTEQ